MTWIPIVCLLTAFASLSGGAQEADPNDLDARIDGLIAQLGDESFEVRQKASRELAKIGAPALPRLREAQGSVDPEVAWRVNKLLEAIGKQDLRQARKRPSPPASKSRPSPRRAPRRRRPGPPLEGFGPDADLQRALGRGLQEVLRQLLEPTPPGRKANEMDQMRRVTRVLEVFTDELVKGDPEASRQWKQAKTVLRSLDALVEGKPLPPLERGEEGPPDRALPLPGSGTGRAVRRERSAHLGIESRSIEPALRLQLGLEGTRGVLLGGVTKNSPAARAGLRQHDIVLAAGGRDVGSIAQIERALQQVPQGSPLRIRILRDGRELEVEIPR